MSYLPSALSKIITTRLFMNYCCLFVSRMLPASLSHTYSGWWALFFGASFSAEFGISGIFWYSNHRNSRSKGRNLLSGANQFPSCRCCSISVHVPTSFLFVVVVDVEHRSRKVWASLADKRVHVWWHCQTIL